MIGFPALPRLHQGRTAYVERGTGKPLLFVHGVGMRAEAWTPQIGHFSATRRVIALDLLGHAESAPPPADPSLHDYVAAVGELVERLNLSSLSIVGHSLGGLVAIGFALANPERCQRMAAFNAVYCRDAASQRAVEARAAEIARTKSSGDIEAPLRRWFGSEPGVQETAAYRAVRGWLSTVDPLGYAAAYGVFARSDRAYVGRLGELPMPALFATGDGDPNSTPAMSQAMAAEAPRGEAAVIPGARHMMNLVEVDAVNALLGRFLAGD